MKRVQKIRIPYGLATLIGIYFASATLLFKDSYKRSESQDACHQNGGNIYFAGIKDSCSQGKFAVLRYKAVLRNA